LFLTGPLRELRAVWSSYGIQVKMVHGDIAHTAGVFVIDPAGRMRAFFPAAARRGGVNPEALSLAKAVRVMVPSGT